MPWILGIGNKNRIQRQNFPPTYKWNLEKKWQIHDWETWIGCQKEMAKSSPEGGISQSCFFLMKCYRKYTDKKGWPASLKKQKKERIKHVFLQTDRETHTHNTVSTAYSLQDYSKILESRLLSKPITSITRVKQVIFGWKWPWPLATIRGCQRYQIKEKCLFISNAMFAVFWIPGLWFSSQEVCVNPSYSW